MKVVYTNENSFLVNNIKNIIEAQEIEVFIKNEYAQGAVGEIAAFDSWPQLWVVNDADYDRAMELVNSPLNSEDNIEWHCQGCAEVNDSSFEVCWNCQREKA